jgi:hypothetical protein
MVRYLVVAAGAFAIMTSLAAAETTTTITRTSPAYEPANKTVVKKHVDRYGRVVTKKKTYHDGYSGSSVSRTRTVTDPVTGMSKSRTTTVHE